ncbi:MAG: SGNH/GDSL hydrolase family protein [Spirochaetales bacterium]|nr:SGNH/GDSL hydrolase family protein [Spirochaetales bacterium]
MENEHFSIFELAHNALSYRHLEDGYVQFLRFNESDGVPFNSHPLYRAMAKTSASICLRFTTQGKAVVHIKRYHQSLLAKRDDQVLDFAALYGRPLDLSESIDVSIDGKLSHHPLANGQLVFEENQEITIHLPLHHQVGVRLEGEVAPRPKQQRTLLLLGDSIIQGVGIHHPSQDLASRLGSLLGVQVINQGLAGAMINAKLVQKLELAEPVASILVSVGTNDWTIRENLAEVRGEMFALLGRIRKFYPKVPVLLLTPLYRTDILQDKRMGSFKELTQAMVQATRCFAGVEVADGLSLSLRDAYDDQFLHPDHRGISFLAKSLAPLIPFQR